MKTHYITQQQLDETPRRDRKWRWPGVAGPGAYTWDEAAHSYKPAHIPSPASQASFDFDRTGLGIGGLSRHDMHGEMLELVARGEMQVVEHERRGPMPHGQLWEPCPRCGQEPVCLSCGLCEQHCIC